MTARSAAIPRRSLVVALGPVLAIAMVFSFVGGNAAGAATATVSQCNNIGSVGGDTISCAVTITNNFAYNAATPGTPTGLATIVTTISCTASVGCPLGGTTTSTIPVTGVTQCNIAGLGGASKVTCTATVTNNLTGYPTGAAIAASVLQCQNPGTVTTLTCVATPSGNNQAGSGGPGGQSVTQCNNSGGAGGTLTCTITAPSSQGTGLPTTINQCVGSGTTGASTVTCTATITNNFLASTAALPPTTTTTTTAAPPVFFPSPTTTTTATPATNATPAPTTTSTTISSAGPAPTTTSVAVPVAPAPNTPGPGSPTAGPGAPIATPGAPVVTSIAVPNVPQGTSSAVPASATSATPASAYRPTLAFTGARITKLAAGGLTAIIFGGLLLLALRRPVGAHSCRSHRL